MTPIHRKIGGIHWFALGRLRVTVCWTRSKRVQARPSDRVRLATDAEIATLYNSRQRINSNRSELN